MSITVEELEAEALDLPAPPTCPLVERLIASMDSDPGIEEAWAKDVERRHEEIEGGSESLLPGPTALARLGAEFQ